MVAALGPAILGDLRADDELVRRLIVRQGFLTIYGGNLRSLSEVLEALGAALAASN